jgi:uncharacterized membrane protein YtjA (UPF0391 family)
MYGIHRNPRKLLKNEALGMIRTVDPNLLRHTQGGKTMLYYALIFLLIAVVCAVLGFGVLSAAAASIAKILFFIFLVVFLVSLVMGRRVVH